MTEASVAVLAELVGGRLIGDGERRIVGLCDLRQAAPDRIGFVRHPRYQQVAAETTAGCGGEALYDLAWLGALQPDQGPQLLLLGTRPSLDLLLQFRAQGLDGWYLPCADDAGVEVIDELNSSVG